MSSANEVSDYLSLLLNATFMQQTPRINTKHARTIEKAHRLKPMRFEFCCSLKLELQLQGDLQLAG
jgi:hypothetical protein